MLDQAKFLNYETQMEVILIQLAKQVYVSFSEMTRINLSWHSPNQLAIEAL